MPRGIPNRLDTDEMDVGQHTHIDMPAEGLLDRSAMHEDGIEIVQNIQLDGYAAELAFMEEKIEVEVHESTDDNAQPIVDVYCQGIAQRFIRGQRQTVKRKFVNILADARQTSLRTSTQINGDTVVNRIDKHSALRFPFSVTRDDNPKGRDWLRQQLKAA
jgi:hypothetical protein